MQTIASSLPWPRSQSAAIATGLFSGLSLGLCSAKQAFALNAPPRPLFPAQSSTDTNAGGLEMLALILFAVLLSTGLGALRRTHAHLDNYRTLVKSMDDGFCIVEMMHNPEGKAVDYRFLECNPAFEKQTGLRKAEGKAMRYLVPGHENHWFETYEKVARTGEGIRFENVAAAMNRIYDVFAFRVGGEESSRVGILFRDITERKKIERNLIDASLRDSLTGLSNRAMCLEHLAKAMARAKRANRKLALLFLDLDGFKAVNDTLGHLAGDNLLRAVAKRLVSSVRAGDVVSRFGGDEFIVILENYEPNQLPEIVGRIARKLELPVDLDEGTVRISVSIGIVTYPDSAQEEETLIQKADAAMYAFKRDRKLRLTP